MGGLVPGFIYKYYFSMYKYTVKKVSDFPVPSPDVTNQTHWPGIIKLHVFLARESFVSEIPAEGGKIASLFFTV
jgi:hypothetical protein